MTKKNNTITIPASGTVHDIPLDKLKKSPRKRRRKTAHPEADIAVFAASIAANGMLQSPVVEPEMKGKSPLGISLSPLARVGGLRISFAPSATDRQVVAVRKSPFHSRSSRASASDSGTAVRPPSVSMTRSNCLSRDRAWSTSKSAETADHARQKLFDARIEHVARDWLRSINRP